MIKFSVLFCHFFAVDKGTKKICILEVYRCFSLVDKKRTNRTEVLLLYLISPELDSTITNALHVEVHVEIEFASRSLFFLVGRLVGNVCWSEFYLIFR